MTLIERFLKYVNIPSASNAGSDTIPSTPEQLALAKVLADDLLAIGVKDARVDEFGYVYGSIPANCEGQPSIGLIAHLDVVDDVPCAPMNARVVKNYDGGAIELGHGYTLDPAEFGRLKALVGKDLIVTDGSTILGADDKAGVAEIIELAHRLLTHPEIRHGDVKIAFTPDEEIGGGAEKLDIKAFGADFAYTLDGGDITDYEYETFNAAKSTVTIHGFSIHPGTSKDRMKNALLIAMEYNALLPALETPGHTEGYEGFFHLQEMHGKVEEATMEYIIRDHSMERFRQRIAVMDAAAEQIDRRYGKGTVTVDTQDQYYNMYEILKDHMEIVELAEAAMKGAGIANPTHSPIRGGTDGCMLTYQGLPCPNLPVGGHNAHGRFEYAPVESLKTGVRTVKQLLSPTLIEAVILKKEK